MGRALSDGRAVFVGEVVRFSFEGMPHVAIERCPYCGVACDELFVLIGEPEKFTKREVIAAIRAYLKFGAAFSGSSWVVRCLQYHLGQLEAGQSEHD